MISQKGSLIEERYSNCKINVLYCSSIALNCKPGTKQEQLLPIQLLFASLLFTYYFNVCVVCYTPVPNLALLETIWQDPLQFQSMAELVITTLLMDFGCAPERVVDAALISDPDVLLPTRLPEVKLSKVTEIEVTMKSPFITFKVPTEPEAIEDFPLVCMTLEIPEVPTVNTPPPTSRVPLPVREGRLAVTPKNFQYPETVAVPMAKVVPLQVRLDDWAETHFPCPWTSTLTVAEDPEFQVPSFFMLGRGESAPGTTFKALF